jgi:signal transduction histidine kinase/ligand-binding sensor domain-containing protein
VSWKNGQVTQYPAFAHRFIRTLLQDRDGTIWAGGFVGATGMLCSIRGASTTCYGDDGSLGNAVTFLYEDSDGSLWVGAATGIWRWKPGVPTRYPAPPTEANKWARHVSVPLPFTVGPVLRDRNGGLWIGGTRAHGIMHSYEGRTSTFTRSDGLSSDVVYALFEDREGTIWAATSEGLDRFRELPVTALSSKQGLSSEIASAVLAGRDGSIWIGTTDGLNRWKDGRTTVYRRKIAPGVPDSGLQSLFEDEHGRIWVSAYGLAVFDKGKFTEVTSAPRTGTTNAIAGDNHGGLWLSLWVTTNDYGLVHLVDGKIVEHVPWQKLGGGPGTGLVPDPDGGIWTGLLSGGIAYYRAGEIRNLSLSDDRGDARRVLEVSRDRDGSIWAATENGLSRIKDGHVLTLTTANGLPCNTVHWIMEDDRSSYWLYTQCGLLRVARADINAWIADPKRSVRPTIFDTADGVRLINILAGTRPSVTKASDGKIWFLNADKVSFIDPSHIATNTLPPPVRIEQITVNSKAYDASRGLRLPPHVRNLVVDYTALSMAAPERVHFRFKLEGQDRDWREVVNARKVEYSNLPPGNYRFRVLASNNSGVWNEQGDVLEFSIAPAYYQTIWFRTLCVVAFFGLLWGWYQLRIRRLQRQFELTLDARVGERTRIARDFHDTLLQSFHGVLLRFQTVSLLLPERAEEAKEKLDVAIDQAANAITEGRDAVQGLRDSTIQGNNLAVAISTLGEELATDSIHRQSSGFCVSVEGQTRELHPIVRDEIYKIGAEALRNAFRHAHAARVEVQIRYDNEQFRLRVRDDGKGIDAAILSAHGAEGHYGLPGMRERATVIGGKLTVWSEEYAGTEVELRVPASKAYMTGRRRSHTRRAGELE